MTVTSGVVSIKKDSTNLIGISIGGGAPLCPCLYIVQVLTLVITNIIRLQRNILTAWFDTNKQ